MKNDDIEIIEDELSVTNKKNRKYFIIAIISIVLIVLGVLVYYLFYMGIIFNSKEVNKDSSYFLNVYLYPNGNYGAYNENETSEVAFTIATENKDAKIIEGNQSYILFIDKIIKVYDIKNKEIKEYESIPTNFDEYYFVGKNMYTKDGSLAIFGIGYGNKYNENNDYLNNCGYYSLKNNKNMFDGYCIKNEIIETEFLEGYSYVEFDYEENIKRITYNVLNTTTEKVVITKKDASIFGGFYLKDKFIIFDDEYNALGSTNGNQEVYSLSGKKIVDANYLSLGAYNSILYVIKNNILTKYDEYGNIITTVDYNTEDKIYAIYRNRLVSVKNNKLKFINLSSGKSIELMDWKNEYYFHAMLSGYYEENELNNENEKQAGYYLVVGYEGNSDTGDSYGKGVEIYINENTNEVKKYELDEIGGYAKPVLYLYPEQKEEINVYFEHNDNLTTTYPKFINSWKVTAYPNGDLYDNNNKYYYGLYWEEKLNHKVNFDEGFYVTKENAINFLEEKLLYIGLNDKERNEFIMYWLPILEKNEKSVVYFELTKERESYNKIIIDPKPDSLLRIAIHVKKVDKKPNIKEEKLEKFERNGFTAVEWGGVIYN